MNARRALRERRVEPPGTKQPPSRSIALGFPNRYRVGMSNLGFQWTFYILENDERIGCERFFVEDGVPTTIESGSALDRFPLVAFSVSWEMDYPLVLRALSKAKIPLRRSERRRRHPLIVFGGNCARINPAPLFDFVDVVAVGDAEKLAPDLADAVAAGRGDRDAMLEALRGRPGFVFPDDGEAVEHAPMQIQQKRPRETFGRFQVPHSVILTPDTELADKLLIEIARGCTEMCRFCWAAYAFAPIVRHSASDILAIAERARPVTSRIGLIATAVADHPEILPVLHGLRALDYHVALSSLKIDAIGEEILAVLFGQGERSLAIAPEAGNDRLRRALNKKVDDAELERKLRLIFRAGFTHLKLYLQIGLPGETDADIDDLVALVRRTHELAEEEGRVHGRAASVVAAVNTFIPKPHTPFENQRLAPREEIDRKLRQVADAVRGIPNTNLRGMPVKEAVWEAYLAKAASGAAPLLLELAAGEKLGSVLTRHADEVSRVVWGEIPREVRPWGFLRKSLPDAAYAGEMA